MTMNLVETIQNQLSGPVVSELGSMMGTSEGATRSVLGAAVPSLLSWFSRMASSTDGGAERLVDAVQRMNPRAPGSIAGMVDQRPDQVSAQGSSLAESLVGNAGVTNIVSSLGRSVGVAPDAAKKLIGFLTPTVLGGIWRLFAGRAVNVQSLKSFFSGQEASLGRATPAAWAGEPGAGMDRAEAAVRAPVKRGRSVIPAVVALTVVALVVFLARSRMPTSAMRGPTDTFSRLGDDLKENVGSVTTTLGSIKDEASADAAVPALQSEMKTLDRIRATAAHLPEDARAKFDALLQDGVGAIREQGDRLASIPGVGKTIQPLLDDFVARLNTPVGIAPADGKTEAK
jgi:hypothetical protein